MGGMGGMGGFPFDFGGSDLSLSPSSLCVAEFAFFFRLTWKSIWQPHKLGYIPNNFGSISTYNWTCTGFVRFDLPEHMIS